MRNDSVEFMVEKEKALLITTSYEDFEGDVSAWQSAYFQILSWKNTLGLAYDVDILDSRSNGAFVRIVMKNNRSDSSDLQKNMVEWLESLGYRKITVNDIVVGTIDGFIDDDEYEDLYEIFID